MKRLIAIILTLICVACIATADNDKSFKKEGNTYSSTGRVKSTSTPIATGCTWVDSKGNQYPIYMSSTGSCYIIRVSKNTGKEYKSYLGPEVSQDICKKLGKEYKSRKK